MKYIRKKAEPPKFTLWKKQNIPLGMGYGQLHSDVKKSLHTSLIQEQGGLCCYCECRVRQEGSHIEHFCPQQTFPGMGLKYDNLHASCQRELQPGEPLHCGHGKANWFDQDLLVSPLDPGCEARFKFTAIGKMVAADPEDVAARETIDKLGLNIEKLQALRKGAIDALMDNSPDQIYQILDMPINGEFQEFLTTIRAVLT
ncbi:MAG: TIGR02646 family protein [Magnetococcales bacterium]|nr:TIGR02646 family protein [Magnetococcales bacterium]HIJ83351.1 TIGR02646 family protein [Magnetococcales bacterium]